jgi:lycopene beta-cyclase
MIRAIDFYSHFLKKVENAPNFEYVNASISEIISNSTDNYINTSIGNFKAKLIFSSLPKNDKMNLKKYPLLNQSFIGWTIETEEDVFDEKTMTLMDFNRNQKDETRFIYVLPFSSRKALVEYTLFSEKIIFK